MRTNRLLAVVHVADEGQALRNVTIARENGADGVFLINHGKPASELRGIFGEVLGANPGFWIGLNFLDLTPSQAINTLPGAVNGLWIDDAGVVDGPDAASRTRDIWALTKERRSQFGALLFGGVAFKYVHRSSNPARDAAVALPYLDVVTTSGEATGKAPSLEKIRSMREAMDKEASENMMMRGKKAVLAVASGMTPENVLSFLDHVDYFLVATGISKDFHNFDPAKVRAMARRMRR